MSPWCPFGQGGRLDELVLGRAVGVERRPLAGAWVRARNATEARALVVRVAPVEAVEPDVALVPLRAGRASRCRVLRPRHLTGVVGPRRDTSDGTKVPSGASGNPHQTRDLRGRSGSMSGRTAVRAWMLG